MTILIPTLPRRGAFLSRLATELLNQIGDQYPVKISVNEDSACSIGKKRQAMMESVTTPYMAFFDDDDMPGPNYTTRIMEGIDKGVDCCSLTGIITTDGKDPKKFIHSIRYTEMFEQDSVYFRPPMHINCIKTELAKQCVFPDWARSEDSNFAFQLVHKGLLKTEYEIPEVIYNYLYVSDKKY